MIDISHKSDSLRTATATGILYADPATITRVKEGTVPKGEVLEICRAAGIHAAKKTPDIIIFCHPIHIECCDISYEIGVDSIRVNATLKAIAKTGVEMEAMHVASAVLVNFYDLLKPIDDNLRIGSIELLEKKGGKSSFVDDFEQPIKTAVLVISDSTYAGTRKDKSGLVIKDFLEKHPTEITHYEILPDNAEMIQNRVKELIDNEAVQLVLTTGGTGFGPKDYTPESIKPILDKEAPGIAEAIRKHGKDRTPFAMLSRELAGIRNESLVICLPGSSRGAQESLDALFPGLLHIFPMLWGGGHKHDGRAELAKEEAKI